MFVSNISSAYKKTAVIPMATTNWSGIIIYFLSEIPTITSRMHGMNKMRRYKVKPY